MNDRTSPSRLSFLVGATGTVLVFAAFYLRNPQPLYDHHEKYGTLGICMAGACLSLLMIGGGVWSFVNRPRTQIKAFSLGLALPSLVFAASGANASDSVRAGPAIAVQPDSPLGSAFRLSFAPLSALEASYSARHRAAVLSLEQQVEAHVASARAAEQQVAALEARIRTVDEQRHEFQEELATARARLARFESESVPTPFEWATADLDELTVEFDPRAIQAVERSIASLDPETRARIGRLARVQPIAAGVELLTHYRRNEREDEWIVTYLPFALEALGAEDVPKPATLIRPR